MFVFKPIAFSIVNRAMHIFNNGNIQRYDGSVRSTSALGYSNSDGLCATGVPTASFIFGATTIQRYNELASSTDSATPATSVTSQSAASIGTNAYMFGGVPSVPPPTRSDTIQKYDGVTASNVAVMVSSLANTAAAQSDWASGIIIFGGTDSSPSTVETLQFFDGSSCGSLGDILSPANRIGMGVGQIVGVSASFAFGGNTSSTYYNSIFRFNGSASIDGAVLAAANTSNGVTFHGTNAFIFGGLITGGTAISTIQRYNGTTRTTDSSTLSSAASFQLPTISNGPSVGFS